MMTAILNGLWIIFDTSVGFQRYNPSNFQITCRLSLDICSHHSVPAVKLPSVGIKVAVFCSKIHLQKDKIGKYHK